MVNLMMKIKQRNTK